MGTLPLRFFTPMAIALQLFIIASAFGQVTQSSDPKPGQPKIIRKSGGVFQGSAIKRVEPVYPRVALAEGISGQVVVEATADEGGTVISARALSGDPVLKEAALAAARGWTFVPTQLNGVPVKVIGTITFNFNFENFDSIEKEIEHYKKNAKENPKLFAAHYMLGRAYIKAKRNQEAINALKQAIDLNPNLAEAHYQLGFAYLEHGRSEEAIAPLKRAIELKPHHALAHHNLGEGYSRLGREEDAIVEFKEAIRHDPDNTESHFLLGHAYFKTGQYKEALKELEHVPTKEQYSNALVWTGLSYFKLGDKEAAMREYKVLLMINKSAAEHLLKEINK